MLEKYEAPEMEFVEVNDEDVIIASNPCGGNPKGYGDILVP